MSNNKLNSTKPNGFTIVELLIVIVVIGILAAITIVSYSGITNRANATKAQTNAANTLKVAEAYNADPPTGVTGYPAAFSNLQSYTGAARVPTGVTLQSGAILAADGLTKLQYLPKGTTGGCIGWWDFGAATPVAKYVFVGDATASNGTTCS